jgi:zinc and cadmium transporter
MIRCALMILTPAIAAFIHCLVILLVGVLPLTWRMHGQIFDAMLAFGAGVLLSAALLHMLPAAIPDLGPAAGVFVLLGYLLMTVLERFTMAHPCGEEACPNHRLGLTALLGLSVHSVIAGMALGVGLLEAQDLSVSAALLAAILVHKVPETLALMGLVAASGWDKRRIVMSLIFFSLSGPAGIFLGTVSGIQSPWILSSALAVSAGTFLYIASSDLLPQLHKKMKQEWVHFLAFLLCLGLLSFEAWHHLLG